MELTVTGTVITTDTQKGTSKSGREWQKKIFVVEFMEGTKQKHIAFEMFGEERINNNPVRKGQTVTVHYDIESTEWNSRWFTTCSAWKVEKFDGKTPTPTPEQPKVDLESVAQASSIDTSDLPF